MIIYIVRSWSSIERRKIGCDQPNGGGATQLFFREEDADKYVEDHGGMDTNLPLSRVVIGEFPSDSGEEEEETESMGRCVSCGDGFTTGQSYKRHPDLDGYVCHSCVSEEEEDAS